PHHTPSPQELHLPHHDSPSPSHLNTTSEPIPQAPTKTLTPRRYTRRAKRIAQSKALSPAVDELASLSRDERQGEAFPTISILDARQDRENTAKTSALPLESSPRVTSLDADEGSIQQRIHELMKLYTSLQGKKKCRANSRGCSNHRGKIEIGGEIEADKSTELGRNDTKEMVNVLTSAEAINILTSGGAAASVSPADVLPAASVPTVSGSFPTVSAIFTTASMVTPYTRRPRGITIGSSQPMRSPIIRAKDKGKKKVVESEFEDFVSMSSKEESERVKRQGLKIDQGSSKRVKISKSVYEDVSEEELKGMIELVKHPIIDWEIHSEGKREYWKIIKLGGHTAVYQFFVDMLKQFDREDLHQLWTLVKEIFNIKQATKDKEKELWVELKRLFEPDFKDQLWTQNQAFMHDPLDWKLYDTCGFHHVSIKDQEIFMLVEKDYPLRKGLSTVMISNKLQVEQYSHMANDLILKIHNIANSPR
nr:hypothetical protein [Tanacetum cinerariifolium]